MFRQPARGLQIIAPLFRRLCGKVKAGQFGRRDAVPCRKIEHAQKRRPETRIVLQKVCMQLEQHRIPFPNRFPDLLDGLAQDAETVLRTASVAVVALVPGRVDELGKQITVRPVKLYAVIARGFARAAAAAKSSSMRRISAFASARAVTPGYIPMALGAAGVPPVTAGGHLPPEWLSCWTIVPPRRCTNPVSSRCGVTNRSSSMRFCRASLRPSGLTQAWPVMISPTSFSASSR